MSAPIDRETRPSCSPPPAPTEELIPIPERTPVTAARLGAMPGLRLISAHETLDRFMALAVDNAVVFLDGVPRHVVNSEALNRSSRAS